jgi:hypothetical protein
MDQSVAPVSPFITGEIGGTVRWAKKYGSFPIPTQAMIGMPAPSFCDAIAAFKIRLVPDPAGIFAPSEALDGPVGHVTCSGAILDAGDNYEFTYTISGLELNAELKVVVTAPDQWNQELHYDFFYFEPANWSGKRTLTLTERALTSADFELSVGHIA